ncbi:MAG: translation initiation factor IF-3 [Candidatus Nealsonbacteria bacterium]|nr:MAG: translation initiation factor IF-3 [Candidatus Nealsonbacteria bacterium]
MQKRTFINRQIRAKEVRVVDESGNQLGVLTLEEALQKAQERNLDLIQVTSKVEPPVCKIMDYGKFLYQQKKREKESAKKQKGGELKGIRLGFNMAQHDLEVKARQAEKFLKEGNKVKIELRLRGREKALGDHAREKINTFLEILQKLIPYKAEREIKREPRGFTMIISKE